MTGRGIDIKILIILSSTEQNSSSSNSSFASVMRIKKSHNQAHACAFSKSTVLFFDQ